MLGLSSSPSVAAERAAPFRVQLDSSLSPERAVLWLRDDQRPFALVGEWVGVRALLGSEPLRVAGASEDPFATLDALPALAPGEAVVGGGWVGGGGGGLGYQLGASIERLPPPPPARANRPRFSLAFYDHVVLFDGERWWFEGLWSQARDQVLRERLELWRARLQGEPPTARSVSPRRFTPAGSGSAGYLWAVDDCRRRIAEGELFQANLSLRLEARFAGEAVDLFARALPIAEPRFGALVDGVVSLSPERFLRRRGRHVEAEPIKGTRPRVGSEHERQSARDELAASGKDAAENVMIVDLMRNDLGRVCAYGTIDARPARVEAHSGVWHLVSTVSGHLRDDVGDRDLLRATFPPGSVTGAPKVQAMKVIATLESTRRELYTGAIGICSPIAGLDLSVAIRTFELAGGKIWFGAGGGIVADSDPELELAEAFAKAAGPVAAIGGELAEAQTSATASDALPHASQHGLRPDPDLGVFETVLIRDGEPLWLDSHLERLAGSLGDVYATSLDPAVAERARAGARASGLSLGRLKLLADPDGRVTVAVEPAHLSGEPVRLLPVLLPGGLGAHKWRDRRLLEALISEWPGTVPLLVDADGTVLEAGYANVWIEEKGSRVTPPADGRILPGVTRARTLADERTARQEAISLARLRRAEAIFLTSSIRGWHPAVLAAP